jgi:hypothetical protein
MKRSPSQTAAVAAYFFSASMASAAVIGSTAYEGPPDFANGYYYTYSFDYAGYGNGGPNNDLGGAPVNATATVEAGVGVGLSGALQFSADATAVPVSGQPYPGPADPVVQYSYWGMGGGNGLAIVNAPTSLNLADYRISMDLRAAGLLNTTTPMEFTVEFQVPDDTLGVDPGTGGDVILALNFLNTDGKAFLVGADFASFTTTLDLNSGISAGSMDLFTQFSGMTTNININMAIPRGGDDFGLDTGNALIIDNQIIEQVPEPAISGMFALAGVGLSLRRSRQNPK